MRLRGGGCCGSKPTDAKPTGSLAAGSASIKLKANIQAPQEEPELTELAASPADGVPAIENTAIEPMVGVTVEPFASGAPSANLQQTAITVETAAEIVETAAEEKAAAPPAAPPPAAVPSAPTTTTTTTTTAAITSNAPPPRATKLAEPPLVAPPAAAPPKPAAQPVQTAAEEKVAVDNEADADLRRQLDAIAKKLNAALAEGKGGDSGEVGNGVGGHRGETEGGAPAPAAVEPMETEQPAEVSPPAQDVALDAPLIEKTTRATLEELGTAITLKQLRQHVEVKMGTPLLAWKAAIKATAAAYAIEQAAAKRAS